MVGGCSPGNQRPLWALTRRTRPRVPSRLAVHAPQCRPHVGSAGRMAGRGTFTGSGPPVLYEAKYRQPFGMERLRVRAGLWFLIIRPERNRPYGGARETREIVGRAGEGEGRCMPVGDGFGPR